MSLEVGLKGIGLERTNPKSVKSKKDFGGAKASSQVNWKASKVKKFVDDNKEAFEEINKTLTNFFNVKLKEELLFIKVPELEEKSEGFEFKFIDLKIDESYTNLRKFELSSDGAKKEMIQKLIGLMELNIINTGSAGLNLPIGAEAFRLYRNYLKMSSDYKRIK